MGSLRRQLTILLLTASPAMAEVCNTLRPGWTLADGPVSAFDELLQFMMWGGGAVLVLALLVGLYLRKTIILNAVLLVALIMSVPYLWPLDPTSRQLALTEGCVGTSTLVTGALGVIWLLALGGTFLKRKAQV